ncbi:hypothetical protein [Paenibacillus alvei]|uniref:hypothetical protein n=1 Tax=Paenibacillus alvei TaxID=44250 RepID=UPI00227E0B3E|nr:hypothetical protein [Paenibacillus alvei]
MYQKIFKVAVPVLTASSLFVVTPTSSFATSNPHVAVNSVAPASTFESHNPWENGKLSEIAWESDHPDTIDMNLKYDDDAKGLFEKLKALNAAATEQSAARIAEENALLNTIRTLNPNKISEMSSLVLDSKSEYRTSFSLVAWYISSLDLPFAARAMLHSLDDKPTDVWYEAGSSLSNGWSWTAAYTTFSIPIAKAISKANSEGKKYVGGDTSIATSAGNAGLDFYLALGKVTISWSAEKQSGGNWKVYIHTYDKYDFTEVKVPNSFPDNIIAIANNQAADAQRVGAIVPYMTHIFNQQDYTP